MKMDLSKVLTVCFLVGFSVAMAAPPVITQQVTPGTMSYQGRLQTPDGEDYTNGIYTIDFKLYEDASGGTFLWGATYKPYVNNGFFSVILGQTSVGEAPIDGAQYTAVDEFWKGLWIDPNSSRKQRFLGITVHENEDNQSISSPQESFPRQQLLASPFAIQAQYAQQASGNFSIPGHLDITGEIRNPNADLAVTDALRVSGNLMVQQNLQVTNLITAGSYGHTFPDNEPSSGDIVSGDDIFADWDIHAGRDLSIGRDALVTGQVKMKPGTVDEHAVASIVEGSQSKMRIVVGAINADGSIRLGQNQGFNCNRTATGIYSIKLTGFSALLTVVTTPTYGNDGSAGIDNFMFTQSLAATGFTVITCDDSPSASYSAQNAGFAFIAIGIE